MTTMLPQAAACKGEMHVVAFRHSLFNSDLQCKHEVKTKHVRYHQMGMCTLKHLSNESCLPADTQLGCS